MGTQMLDGHVVTNQRQVVAEQRARGRREREHAVLDQARNGHRRQALRPARDPELRIDGDAVSVRRGESVDANDTGEP